MASFNLFVLTLVALYGVCQAAPEIENHRAYNILSAEWTLLTATEAGNKAAFAGNVTTVDGSANLIKEAMWEAERWDFVESPPSESGFIWRFKTRSFQNSHNAFSYYHHPTTGMYSPQAYYLRQSPDGSGKWYIHRASGWGQDGDMCLENIARGASPEMRPCDPSNRSQLWGIYRAE